MASVSTPSNSYSDPRRIYLVVVIKNKNKQLVVDRDTSLSARIFYLYRLSRTRKTVPFGLFSARSPPSSHQHSLQPLLIIVAFIVVSTVTSLVACTSLFTIHYSLYLHWTESCCHRASIVQTCLLMKLAPFLPILLSKPETTIYTIESRTQQVSSTMTIFDD